MLFQPSRQDFVCCGDGASKLCKQNNQTPFCKLRQLWPHLCSEVSVVSHKPFFLRRMPACHQQVVMLKDYLAKGPRNSVQTKLLHLRTNQQLERMGSIGFQLEVCAVSLNWDPLGIFLNLLDILQSPEEGLQHRFMVEKRYGNMWRSLA